MNEQHKHVLDLLVTLEGDLEVVGWDKPVTLYGVAGTLDDPHLVKVVEAPIHPIDLMQAAYDTGRRVPEDALGIVMATESWRHLTFEEVCEREPEAVAFIREKIAAEFDRQAVDAPPDALKDLGDTREERIERLVRDGYHQTLALLRPADMPDEKRVEMRMLTCVFQNGDVMVITRERGSDPVTDYNDGQWEGAVPDAMRRFLKGESPMEQEPAPITPYHHHNPFRQ